MSDVVDGCVVVDDMSDVVDVVDDMSDVVDVVDDALMMSVMSSMT